MTNANARERRTPEGVVRCSAWTLGDGVWHCSGTRAHVGDSSGPVFYETVRWTEGHERVSWWKRVFRLFQRETEGGHG